MQGEPARWIMAARGEPRVPGSDEVAVEVAGCGVGHTDLGFCHDGVRTQHALPPFVEKHPLSEINRVFAAAHAGGLKGRAILVPSQQGAQ